MSAKWSQRFNLWLYAVRGSPTGTRHPGPAFQKTLRASETCSSSVVSKARPSGSCFCELEQLPRAVWDTQITIACFPTIRQTANQRDHECVGPKGIGNLYGYHGLDPEGFYVERKHPQVLSSCCQIVFGEVRLLWTAEIEGDLLGGRPAFIIPKQAVKTMPYL